MLIGIGVANGNNGNNEMMGTLAFLAHELGKAGHDMVYLGRDSCYPDLNRNEIMATAKELGADGLLFIDTDTDLVTEGSVLSHMIGLGKDIVTGVYYQGSYPYRPVVYTFGEKGIRNFADIPAEPFPVEAAGAGFLFISKKVIDHFKDLAPGERPFDYLYAPLFLREDAAFCWRCRQAGFEIWADPRIKLNHWKRQPIDEKWWLAAKKKIAAAPLDKAKDGGLDGWMSAEELEFLRKSAAESETVVEIGSWKGRSTKDLLETGAHVTAVDHWQGSDTIKELAESQDLYAEFLKNVGHYPNLRVMRMPSLEAAASLNGDLFDIVFIDGSHDYENVKADIAAWLPRTKRILCGHDYAPGWPGVMRAVREQFGDRVQTVDTIWWVDLTERRAES